MGPTRTSSGRPLVEITRPNRLFTRLAEALLLSDVAAEALVHELLASTDATAATITTADVRAMHARLVQVIDAIFPDGEREAARARLEALLDE